MFRCVLDGERWVGGWVVGRCSAACLTARGGSVCRCVGVQVCRCESIPGPLAESAFCRLRFVYEIAIFGTDMAELVGCQTHPVTKLSFAISK